MNKERFHNVLALNLGYDRIVNDGQISIKIDETTPVPVVTLTSDAIQHSVSFTASEDEDSVYSKLQKTMGDVIDEQDLKEIIDAVHQAYIYATIKFF